jgi:hypothetical protein
MQSHRSNPIPKTYIVQDKRHSIMATILSDLASTIGSALSSLPPPDQIQDAERMQVLSAISRLQEALEPPAMAVQRMGLSVRCILMTF